MFLQDFLYVHSIKGSPLCHLNGLVHSLHFFSRSFCLFFLLPSCEDISLFSFLAVDGKNIQNSITSLSCVWPSFYCISVLWGIWCAGVSLILLFGNRVDGFIVSTYVICICIYDFYCFWGLSSLPSSMPAPFFPTMLLWFHPPQFLLHIFLHFFSSNMHAYYIRDYQKKKKFLTVATRRISMWIIIKIWGFFWGYFW